MPCAHFSNLPSAPQADNARKSGMVKPLSPGTELAIPERTPPSRSPPVQTVQTIATLSAGRQECRWLSSCRQADCPLFARARRSPALAAACRALHREL